MPGSTLCGGGICGAGQRGAILPRLSRNGAEQALLSVFGRLFAVVLAETLSAMLDVLDAQQAQPTANADELAGALGKAERTNTLLQSSNERLER